MVLNIGEPDSSMSDVFKDKFNRSIRLTSERKAHIEKHPEMKNQMDKIKETIQNPDFIRCSAFDESVLLFYKPYAETPVGEKYLLVAVKILNSHGFIITAFFTDKLKKGEHVWPKD